MVVPQYAISQLQFVRSGLHLVTNLDVGNFCDKSIETTLHEICVQVFLRFSKSSKPSQSVSLIYECARLVDSINPRKTCSKLHERLFLRPKLPTYFDDVTTIENNRQVRVNVDATLVAIFRITYVKWKYVTWGKSDEQELRAMLAAGQAGKVVEEFSATYRNLQLPVVHVSD